MNSAPSGRPAPTAGSGRARHRHSRRSERPGCRLPPRARSARAIFTIGHVHVYGGDALRDRQQQFRRCRECPGQRGARPLRGQCRGLTGLHRPEGQSRRECEQSWASSQQRAVEPWGIRRGLLRRLGRERQARCAHCAFGGPVTTAPPMAKRNGIVNITYGWTLSLVQSRVFVREYINDGRNNRPTGKS